MEINNKVNAIDVKNVTKIYKTANAETRALKNANLTIFDNEFFTLLGPSGCGKTTLLRLIAGFEDITEGSINLFDEEIVNFVQVCPKEMLDKLENPMSLKPIIKEVS